MTGTDEFSESVRARAFDMPAPVFDDSEGMRSGVEAIGVIVLVVIALTVIVGLAILSQHLPW